MKYSILFIRVQENDSKINDSIWAREELAQSLQGEHAIYNLQQHNYYVLLCIQFSEKNSRLLQESDLSTTMHGHLPFNEDEVEND